jgi:hypothetical protein
MITTESAAKMGLSSNISLHFSHSLITNWCTHFDQLTNRPTNDKNTNSYSSSNPNECYWLCGRKAELISSN